jgi:pimeloyl-ACP methyl ester carboxylesterase
MHRQEHVVDGVFGYRFAGDEPSHAVLVCHGMGGHGGIYDVFGEAYARVGAEVWCIDLPGCGRSTSTRRPGSFTVAEWVDATVGYAAHIRAATRLPVVVLGSSLGVMPAAAALGANDDIVAAVLMGFAVAGLPGQEPHPFRSEAGQAILAQVGTTAAVKIDRLVDFDADYGYPGAGEAKRRDPLNTWEFDLASYASLYTYDPVTPPADNTKPVLFAVGENDPLSPPALVRSVADLFGGPVEVFEQPKGVHQLMLFHTADFCAAIREFVARAVL